jgi:hypothetical protein
LIKNGNMLLGSHYSKKHGFIGGFRVYLVTIEIYKDIFREDESS